MERQADGQYDDDLTVGIGDYEDESIDAGYVDLFEYSGEEESPISRLKTIVLSIDWEITDEVLTQFNEELLDLQDIWAGDPIKLVYVQALQKISKYIFQQKSNAHPSAIKLLLTFYYNLEKIVLDDQLSEDEKKEILRTDVKKFEQLKRQIEAETGRGRKAVEPALSTAPLSLSEEGAAHPVLFNLKACILGMDWEITERELGDLSKEIRRLEIEFAGNKPRMLFLQGIEALGGYIKLKRSNAHADAFKLLYSFYEGLERIVVNDFTLEEEKAILLPEVEKFEQFKKIISPSLFSAGEQDHELDGAVPIAPDEGEESGLAPAFADVPEEVQGFQADEEAAGLGESLPDDVESRLDDFFSEAAETDQTVLAESERHAGEEKKPVDSFSHEAAERVSSFFDEEESKVAASYPTVSAEEALRGVDVETEADDDSDEEALPTQPDGKLAPALADTGEELAAVFEPEPGIVAGAVEEAPGGEVEERLNGFFGDSEAAPASEQMGERVAEEEGPASPIADEESFAPALAFEADIEEGFAGGAEASEGDLEDRLDNLFADHATELPAALEGSDFSEDIEQFVAAEDETLVPSDDLAPALFESEETLVLEEEQLGSFFEEPESVPGTQLDAGERDHEVEDQVAAFFQEPGESGMDEAPEDVVFSPVAAEEVAGEQDLPTALLEPEGDEGFNTFASESDEAEFFAAIDERVDEPGEFQMELLDEKDEFDTRTAFPMTAGEEPASMFERSESEQEGSEPEAEVLVDTEESEQTEDTYFFGGDDDLGDLRAGIASLGVEISDTIIEGILSAVNSLRHHYANKPAEKTFLQLISTIVQHIGQYRYEASAEAHGLLLSVFDKLELIQNPEFQPDQTLEVLLAETTKVLFWQQTMLDRQAIRKGDELTFLAPVRSDQTISPDEQAAIDEDGELLAFSEQDDVTLEAPTEAEGAEAFTAVFEPVSDEEGEAEEDQRVEPTLPADDAPLLSLDDEPDFLAGVEEDSSEHVAAVIADVDEAETEELFPPEEAALLSLDDETEFVAAQDQLIADDEPVGLRQEESGEEAERPRDIAAEETIADYVKKELEALRVSLQAEIEDIRKRLETKGEE